MIIHLRNPYVRMHNSATKSKSVDSSPHEHDADVHKSFTWSVNENTSTLCLLSVGQRTYESEEIKIKKLAFQHSMFSIENLIGVSAEYYICRFSHSTHSQFVIVTGFHAKNCFIHQSSHTLFMHWSAYK